MNGDNRQPGLAHAAGADVTVEAAFAVLLARTSPDVPKHEGITYFLLDMRQPGVQIRPLPHIGGEVEFLPDVP